MPHGASGHLQYEAVVAGDVVRLHDLRRRVEQVVERLVVAVRIPQPYEGENRQTEAFLVHHRRVTADDAGLLQTPHPLCHSARRHRYGPRELGERRAPLTLQHIENAPVGGVRGIVGHVKRKQGFPRRNKRCAGDLIFRRTVTGRRFPP